MPIYFSVEEQDAPFRERIAALEAENARLRTDLATERARVIQEIIGIAKEHPKELQGHGTYEDEDISEDVAWWLQTLIDPAPDAPEDRQP